MVLDGYTVGRLTTPSGLIDDTIVINYGNDKVSATARIHAEPGETVTIYHDNGERETVLPTSVVARHVLQNLQIEIINAEFAGNHVRLRNLAELQTEWSWIRRDLLRSEVEQKLGVRTLSKTYVPKGTHKQAIEENVSSDSIVRPTDPGRFPVPNRPSFPPSAIIPTVRAPRLFEPSRSIMKMENHEAYPIFSVQPSISRFPADPVMNVEHMFGSSGTTIKSEAGQDVNTDE